MRSKTGNSIRQAAHEQPDDQACRVATADEPDQPAPHDEPDESSDLDEIDPDDERWDVFIADDDERDPQPDYGDFWPAD